MGVDSGLPDFRGREGFWNAYPPFRDLGLGFSQLADPRWFHRDPRLAWGFYGHRLNLYRRTRPHRGFELLRQWASACKAGAWVFTSNVDGQFQLAGFPDDRVVECHGSIHRLQCVHERAGRIWSANNTMVAVDEVTMRAIGPLPADPDTGKLARPNICMFNDDEWNVAVTEDQWERYQRWVRQLDNAQVIVVELGAGTAIPSVRNHCEAMADRAGHHLVRINPREPRVQGPHTSIPGGALAVLEAIEVELGKG